MVNIALQKQTLHVVCAEHQVKCQPCAMGIGPGCGSATGAAQGEPKLQDHLSKCFCTVTCTVLQVLCASLHCVVFVEVTHPKHMRQWGRQISDPATYCIQHNVGVWRIIVVEFG